MGQATVQIRKLVLLIWLFIPLFYLYPKAPGLLVTGRFPWKYFSLRIFAWLFFLFVCIRCKCIGSLVELRCWMVETVVGLITQILSPSVTSVSNSCSIKIYLYMWKGTVQPNLWLVHKTRYFAQCPGSSSSYRESRLFTENLSFCYNSTLHSDFFFFLIYGAWQVMVFLFCMNNSSLDSLSNISLSVTQ